MECIYGLLKLKPLNIELTGKFIEFVNLKRCSVAEKYNLHLKQTYSNIFMVFENTL